MDFVGHHAVEELRRSATQRVLSWFRNAPQPDGQTSHGTAEIVPFPVTAQAVAAEEPIDPRVARIISEIPQRRRREHRQQAA